MTLNNHSQCRHRWPMVQETSARNIRRTPSSSSHVRRSYKGSRFITPDCMLHKPKPWLPHQSVLRSHCSIFNHNSFQLLGSLTYDWLCANSTSINWGGNGEPESAILGEENARLWEMCEDYFGPARDLNVKENEMECDKRVPSSQGWKIWKNVA